MPHVGTESFYRVRLRKDAELPDCTDFNASNNTFNRAMRRSEGELIERAKLLSDGKASECNSLSIDVERLGRAPLCDNSKKNQILQIHGKQT